jgi:SAM-dependent methyltransferase
MRVFKMNRFPLDSELELPIETRCSETQLQELFSRIGSAWQKMGREDPYWSVLTSPDFRAGVFEQHQEQFWASGATEVSRLKAWLKRNGIAWLRDDYDVYNCACCLEYGCGVGRVTRHLADEFEEVLACDISESHLKVACDMLQSSPWVNTIQLDSPDRLRSLPIFDLLFSVIVLQHNPPPLISHILNVLLGKLNLGGVAYFQVPTFIRNYTFNCQAYLDDPNRGSGMEMHCLPQRYIFEIARENGCRVLEVEQDDLTGCIDHVSTTFLMTK